MSERHSNYSDSDCSSVVTVYQCRLCPGITLKKEETDAHREFHNLPKKRPKVKNQNGSRAMSSRPNCSSAVTVYQCRLCPGITLKKEEKEAHREFHNLPKKRPKVKNQDRSRAMSSCRQRSPMNDDPHAVTLFGPVDIPTKKSENRSGAMSSRRRSPMNDDPHAVTLFGPVDIPTKKSGRIGDKSKRRIKPVIHKKPKHSCQLCGKQFMWQWNLDTHVRSHTGERPFSCLICRNRFIQKVHLVRHLSALHCREYEEKPHVREKLSKRRKMKTTANGSKKISCCFCGELTPNRNAVHKHISKTHDDMII